MPKKKPVAEVEVVVDEVKAQCPSPRMFTAAELFYITEKARTSSPEDIAEALECSVEDVTPHIPANPVEGQGVPQKNKSMMHDLMGGVSKSGKRGGMAVMTPQGSQFSDATRPGRVGIQGRNVECIHKPLG